MTQEGGADPLAALQDRVDALQRTVQQLAERVARQSPDPEARMSAGAAAAIYGCDKTWMRKLVVRRRLGEVRDGRWRVDPRAFAAFVAATRPERLPALRRWQASASKARLGAFAGATTGR